MINREKYLEKIRPFIDKEEVKVLTGMRRCGKSVMMSFIMDEIRKKGTSDDQIITYNFEQKKNAHLTTDDNLHHEVNEIANRVNKKLYLFFDEIQEVVKWEKIINSFRVDFDCDIYITGSNANLLSGELATYLSGRYVEIKIYPFSYTEFKEWYSQLGISDDTNIFNEYLRWGGLPGLINYHGKGEDEAAKAYLSDIFSTIVLKDIISRNSIREVDLLDRLIGFVINEVGHTFSARSISKYMKNENRKVSVDTILNYLSMAEKAFLINKVSREDLVGKKILESQEKYYVMDHGLREAIYGNTNDNIDQVLENIVYIELLRRGYKVTVGKVDSKEIDFVAKKGNEKIYIQVSYLLTTEDVREREFGIYSNVKDNYPKYVVSMDQVDFSRDGIKHYNIIKFLESQDI